MLLNQLTFFSGFCFFFCSVFFLWTKWRKIGIPLVVLLIMILFIFSVGIVKSSVIGSMRLDSSSSIINIDIVPKYNNRDESLLDTLKSWSKIIRGKKPIYSSNGGSEIKVDSIGKDKSIDLIKHF